MKYINSIVLVTLALFIGSCKLPDCDKLPLKFESYAQAVNLIRTTSFKIQETIETSNSSWIRSSSYFSCDGNVGYFIIKTDKKEYLFSGMPVNVWNEYKNSDSYGTYYNKNIKGKYSYVIK